MSLTPETAERLQALLTALADDTLAEDERAELESILLDSPEAQEFYVDFSSLNSELARIHRDTEQPVGHAVRDKATEPAELERASEGSRACGDSEPNAIPLRAAREGEGVSLGDNRDSARGACPTPRKSLLNWASRHPKVPAIAIAIAVLLMVVGVMAITPMGKWLAGSGKNTEEQQPESPATSDFVAILNNSHKAKWLDGTQPRLKDPRLKVGRRLAIASGLIEVKYYTGAKVVIEGPAEFYVGPKDEGGGRKKEGGESEGHPSSFILHPSNSGYLALGKLVARVEGKKAQGFTIDTPSGRVEDHGTEFGVEVNRSGDSEFVVLSGEVDVVREDGDGSAQRMRLVKDQGAYVVADDSRIVRRESADAKFVASLRQNLLARFPTAYQLPLDTDAYTWHGGAGTNWFDPNNWSPAPASGLASGVPGNLVINSGPTHQPTAAVNVNVDNDRSVTINGGHVTWSGRFHTIGNVGTGSLVITDGSLTINYSGSESRRFNVGNVNRGLLRQQGGTVTAKNDNDEIFIGNKARGTGTYEISGGTVNAGAIINGNEGAGTFHIIGGDATIDVGSYAQNSRSSLRLDAGGAISPIRASENVSLAGALQISFANTPAVGDEFLILTYAGQLTGKFDHFDRLVDSPAGSDSVELAISYGSGSDDRVTVRVVSVNTSHNEESEETPRTDETKQTAEPHTQTSGTIEQDNAE